MAEPKTYRAIMVSSTFSDIVKHRRDVIAAIEEFGFRANVMETSGAQADTDVIDTSLRMVRDSAAFVGVISRRYGQTPECPDRNPDALSISELEFNEAMSLGRPILLFIMGDKHLLTEADFESDPDKKAKLDAFRERAKKMRDGSTVERIYEVFNSQEQFTKAASIAVGKLSQSLPPHGQDQDGTDDPAASLNSIETALPPDLRAGQRYLGSHEFVGRTAELNTLDDWCAAPDQNPMLLFEAIGGAGKSMVTWTWLTDRATSARGDWAGRFWFSFYEAGATMASFCREALAYMTGQPVKAFRKETFRTLMPQLVAELEARPWLIVMDGLERILVAYHRIDAAQVRDEDVDRAEDQISNRDPRAAINPMDEELLRLLTAAAPSKILVTSRLTPQALINNAGLPMPGVRREMLPGLRPTDAEMLLVDCGVTGDSKAMQDYVQRNCDCHPLVIGALAGLVNAYMPDRGNFDAWLADPAAGGNLGIADLNLTQRRNHILDTAIDALPEPGRKLLQTLSLLQGGVDYATLKEFNPHLPPSPEEVKEPPRPEKEPRWLWMDDEKKETAKSEFKKEKKARAAYLELLKEWEQNPEVIAAPARFDETLTELERRGLLQYDHGLKCYDLHPVVRGVAAGRMGKSETGEIGAQVADYFSSRPHDPFEQAECLADLAPGIQLVATLTRIGQFDRALDALTSELTGALFYNLMAHGELLRLIRPFFPQGWEGPLPFSDELLQVGLIDLAGAVLSGTDPPMAQRLHVRHLRVCLKSVEQRVSVCLRSLADVLTRQGKLESAERLGALNLDLCEALGDDQEIFCTLLVIYNSVRRGDDFDHANALWARLDQMGRSWRRGGYYRGGDAERLRADFLFRRGALTRTVLTQAETLCRESRHRYGLCHCLSLRGEWHLSLDETDLAIDPLNEALRHFREAGLEDAPTEALLVLARLRAGQSVDARPIAERLDQESSHSTLVTVAEIWRELGEPERACAAAQRAHESACGSGEPYVYRYHLDRADALLRDMGETPPDVPKHNHANDEVFDWEDDVRALIERTRKEREERERQEAESE